MQTSYPKMCRGGTSKEKKGQRTGTCREIQTSNTAESTQSVTYITPDIGCSDVILYLKWQCRATWHDESGSRRAAEQANAEGGEGHLTWE
jgi:hypothetical protein